MDIERERGITIKAQTAALTIKAKDGQIYNLNLIDTPGHVDFSYEVSRSLAACEGALLVVDAAQGVEAQTVANCYTALELDVEVVPVLNKIDLPAADPGTRAGDRGRHRASMRPMRSVLGQDRAGRRGGARGHRRPHSAAKGDPTAPLKALIIDSWFDNYVGVVMLVRVVDGSLKPKDKILLHVHGLQHPCDQVGVFTPKSPAAGCAARARWASSSPASRSSRRQGRRHDHPGQRRRVRRCRLQGDQAAGLRRPVPGGSSEYDQLRESLEKLRLNDASCSSSPRCRRRSASASAAASSACCTWRSCRSASSASSTWTSSPRRRPWSTRWSLNGRRSSSIENPAQAAGARQVLRRSASRSSGDHFPAPGLRRPVITLCNQKRGAQIDMRYHGRQVQLIYDMPMNEVVMDFFDKLKIGVARLRLARLRIQGVPAADLVKLDVLVNGEKVDALSVIVHRASASTAAASSPPKLREPDPAPDVRRAIQAAIGSNIIARETIKALRKNVLAKCYGGDITRKKKLLEKQKEGKKRMKQVGNVEIPQEAFLAVLRVDEGK
jgi:GTP-binding protein LepA